VMFTQMRACDAAKVHDYNTTRQVELRANQAWAQARNAYYTAYSNCLHEGHTGHTCEDVLGVAP
jgi:hypothetical protein